MMQAVIIIFPSPTVIHKAKKLLTGSGIGSNITKISSKTGCAYALTVSKKDARSAINLLKKHGISFIIGA